MKVSTQNDPRKTLFSGLRVVSFCTLLSRVLGMVRDVGMAMLFGNSVVMDAFSIAFRIPNLARRLFGEGALTAAFLPAFLREKETQGIDSAWRLASAVLAVLAIVLAAGVIVTELFLWGLLQWGSSDTETVFLIKLIAIMLPYLVLICLAAQVSAILHGLNHFTLPALLPIILNIFWIAAIWLLAPQFASQSMQAIVISATIVGAGLLQFLAPLPQLYSLGFRFDKKWRFAQQQMKEMTTAMLPVIVGLSVTQLNTLADSLIAWSFSRPEWITEQTAASFFSRYPLEAGTASALYFGQRLYQFPLGMIGVALGTVLFPLLSRHAQQKNFDAFRDDLGLGLRLNFVIGIPASLGLMILAEPITRLLFQRGNFNQQDVLQTATIIRAYASAVWAYCTLLLLHRGFYALEDRMTPLKIGLGGVALNLFLNFTFIWHGGGAGLAWATAFTAMVQTIVCTWFLVLEIGGLNWNEISKTFLKSLLATILMGAACYATLFFVTDSEIEFAPQLAQVFLPITVAIGVYLTAAKLLGLQELGLLLQRKND
ncbi:Proposed peptidoglycan lipid II flippase MurJ [hydrothermal vent metagenome]|uniref:Proposed peptidoglycan lipid II flippase MurJ n=1 Tax=hydrothermal vent metagenome TaxID=652676 RepID=A0A3B1E2J8_9ZZZZ